jgi:hypothetical protein
VRAAAALLAHWLPAAVVLIQPDWRRAPRGSALADSNGAPFFQIILPDNNRKKISHAGRCG